MAKITKCASKEAWLAGICGGIAKHYDIDPFLVRIVTLVFSEVLFPFYIVLYFLMPDYEVLEEEESK